MTVDEAIRHRRSIRNYLSKPVPVSHIREILSLANLAPSSGNRQAWRFIVMTNADLLRKIAELVERRIDEMAVWPEFEHEPLRINGLKNKALHFGSAPVAIFLVNVVYRSPLSAVLADHGMEAWQSDRLFSYPDLQSISSVAAFITLAAEERGYGTCWLTEPLLARKDLRATLGLQPKEELAAIMTMGTPAESPPPKPRRGIDELIEWR